MNQLLDLPWPSMESPTFLAPRRGDAPAFIWISKWRSTLKHFKHQHAAGPPQLTSGHRVTVVDGDEIRDFCWDHRETFNNWLVVFRPTPEKSWSESQFCQLCPWVLARSDMSPRLLAHLTICTHSPLFRWPRSSEICNSVSSRMEVFPNSLGRSWPIHKLRSTIDRKNGFCIPILPQRTALLYLQLGWWDSQYDGKVIIQMFQSPPTRWKKWC